MGMKNLKFSKFSRGSGGKWTMYLAFEWLVYSTCTSNTLLSLGVKVILG